ncbi:MAG: hypothetical protein KC620_08870 [Myxococcales bacterium]|nr:hypothetical protein [Myxococcales bacterium]
MRAFASIGVLLLAAVAFATEPPPESPAPEAATPAPAAVNPAAIAAGKAAFGEVFQVLLSPRCAGCHPNGDRHRQGDDRHFHTMNISRLSERNGLECATCHQTQNSEQIGMAGGPPGAPNWHLPNAAIPLIFEGHTPATLCAQLKDPARNGARTLEAVLHHVSSDPLVLWGWQPGGDRSAPALSHEAFVKAFRTWVEAGGPCPDADAAAK